jgi:hypothetical protein
VDHALTYIEQQQKELEAVLDRYEREFAEKTKGENRDSAVDKPRKDT